MDIFTPKTFTWWQFGVFKIALLAIGLAAGAYWHEFFAANMLVVIVIAIVASLYVLYAALSQ